jgi:hypothetical protein
MSGEVNQTSHTHEEITRAMGLADLQIKLLEVDMASATRDSIGALFKGYEEDNIAGRMQENAQGILEFKSNLDDRELIKALFKIEPRGRVDIETTAYSIACDFHNLADWAQVYWKGRQDINKLLRIPRMLIPKGYASVCNGVNIDANRAFGIRKVTPVKRHELRHSMNAEVSPRKLLDGCLTNYMRVPDDELVDTMIRDFEKRTMHPLKDEISAFIFGENQSKFSLKHFVFPFSPIIDLYNFNGEIQLLKKSERNGKIPSKLMKYSIDHILPLNFLSKKDTPVIGRLAFCVPMRT